MNKRMNKLLMNKRWIPALLAVSIVAPVPVAAATLTVGKASIQRLFVEGVFNRNGRWYLQDGVCYAYLESPRTWLAGGRVHIEAHLSSQLGVEMAGSCAGNALAAKVEMSGSPGGRGHDAVARRRAGRSHRRQCHGQRRSTCCRSMVPAPPPLDVLKYDSRTAGGLGEEVPISVDKLSIDSVTTSDADVTVQFDFALRAP